MRTMPKIKRFDFRIKSFYFSKIWFNKTLMSIFFKSKRCCFANRRLIERFAANLIRTAAGNAAASLNLQTLK